MWVGLEAEEYDREFRDRALLKRILEYFTPYKKYMFIVIVLLILSSLSNAFVPLITSISINILAVNPNLVSFMTLIGLIFI